MLSVIVLRQVQIIFSVLIGFVMIPIYISFVGTELMGYWLASGFFLAVISSIDPGLTFFSQTKIARFLGSKNYESISKIIFFSFVVFFLAALLILGIGISISFYISEFLNMEQNIQSLEFEHTFRLGVYGTVISLLAFLYSSINFGLQSLKLPVIITICSNVLASLITYYLLLRGFGLESLGFQILTGAVINLAGQIAIFIYLTRIHQLKIDLDLSNFFTLLKELSFTFISKVSSIVVNNLDALIVTKVIGPVASVTYVMSKKSFLYAFDVINQIIQSFLPRISFESTNNDHDLFNKDIGNLISLIFFVTIIFCSTLLILNEDFVTIWLGKEFYVGQTSNIYLTISFFFYVFAMTFLQIIFSLHRIKLSSSITFVWSISQAIIMYFLTIKFGFYGAAISMGISALLIVLIPLFFIPTLINIKKNNSLFQNIFKRFIQILLVIFSSYATSYFFVESWIELILKGSFNITFSIILLLFTRDFRESFTFIISNRVIKDA